MLYYNYFQTHYDPVGQKIWVGNSRINITDIERSLIDGLAKPQLCGGIHEVLHCIKMAAEKFDLERIIQYAMQMNATIAKRLGWVLSKCGFTDTQLIKLQRVPLKGFCKLDPSQPSFGKHVNKWKIRENIYGD